MERLHINVEPTEKKNSPNGYGRMKKFLEERERSEGKEKKESVTTYANITLNMIENREKQNGESEKEVLKKKAEVKSRVVEKESPEKEENPLEKGGKEELDSPYANFTQEAIDEINAKEHGALYANIDREIIENRGKKKANLKKEVLKGKAQDTFRKIGEAQKILGTKVEVNPSVVAREVPKKEEKGSASRYNRLKKTLQEAFNIKKS